MLTNVKNKITSVFSKKKGNAEIIVVIGLIAIVVVALVIFRTQVISVLNSAMDNMSNAVNNLFSSEG